MRPAGVLLAGGLGRRIGGDKALVALGGVPLAVHALAALREACDEVAVVAKAGTALPDLGVPVWAEPDEPRHPLTGLLHALRTAAGPVLVLAVDMPFAGPALRTLRDAGPDGAPAAVARAGGRLQPLCGLYLPAALPGLEAAGPDARLTAAVERLRPRVVEVGEELVFDVDRPEDLAAAEARLRSRAGRPPSRSR